MIGLVMNNTLLREIGFAGALALNVVLLAKNFGYNLV